MVRGGIHAVKGRRGRNGIGRSALVGLGLVASAAIIGAVVQLHQAARPAGRSAPGCAVHRPITAAAATALAARDRRIGLASWSAFQPTPGHNLILPGVTPAGDPLAAQWQFQTRGEVSIAPSVVDGVAYFGSSDHCVYAVEMTTGQELWAVSTPNMVMSEPLVVDNRVFFGYGDKTVLATATGFRRGAGPSGVEAVAAQTGKRLWRFPTGGEVMPTLLYRDGTVYAPDGNAMFYALAASTGKLLWDVHEGSIDSMSSPVLVGDMAIFGGADPYAFYGINLNTHRLAWTTQLGKGTPWDAEGGIDDISPTVAGGLVFLQNPEGVFPTATSVEFALNPQTGRIVWQQALGHGIITVSDREEVGVATAVNGILYVGAPEIPGLWALRVSNGTPVWKTPAPLPQGIRAAPTVVGPDIYTYGSGWVWVVDRTTGQLLRSLHLSQPGTINSCAPPPVTIVGQTALLKGANADSIAAIPLRQLSAAKATSA